MWVVLIQFVESLMCVVLIQFVVSLMCVVLIQFVESLICIVPYTVCCKSYVCNSYKVLCG